LLVYNFRRSQKGRRYVERDQPLGGLRKRVIDIALAAIFLVLISPMIVMLLALILVFVGRPVIIGQDRIGYNGSRFVQYRFRTTREAQGASEQAGLIALSVSCDVLGSISSRSS
jgi:lipopolysaccharide/colanic/teichoic acid biosynthesis glycosyltransferase